MHITRHAKKRIKQRKGLPVRAHKRHLSHVIKNGKLHSRISFDSFKMVYQDFLYIFVLSRKLQPRLITLYSIDRASQL